MICRYSWIIICFVFYITIFSLFCCYTDEPRRRISLCSRRTVSCRLRKDKGNINCLHFMLEHWGFPFIVTKKVKQAQPFRYCVIWALQMIFMTYSFTWETEMLSASVVIMELMLTFTWLWCFWLMSSVLCRDLLVTLALGQVLSLLICAIGLTSKYLADDFHANTPVFQSFLNYILLFLVYTTTLAVRQGRLQLEIQSCLCMHECVCRLMLKDLWIRHLLYTCCALRQIFECAYLKYDS